MNSGFSLIELLIVLTVTAVLAAVTYPNYTNYIRRAHRIEAQTALLDLACRMEDYYSKHNSYQSATIGTGKPTDILTNNETVKKYYLLSIKSVTDATYTLQAYDSEDKDCPYLTLNNNGTRGASTQNTLVPCW